MKKFPIDPRAPELRVKRFENLPWQCQHGCFARTCTTGEGECPPERLTARPAMREDREQWFGNWPMPLWRLQQWRREF